MTQQLSANALLSHYRIVSKIGAGGMGDVYLAEDTRLDRKVALKLLPAQFTQHEDRVRRFILEARAVSALQSSKHHHHLRDWRRSAGNRRRALLGL
jgi:serine/threonine protein kinase